MGLMWIKDPERIIREGNLQIDETGENYFFDHRCSNAFEEDMYEILQTTTMPFRVDFRSRSFSAERYVYYEEYSWEPQWIKMIIPDGFKIKRRL